jgi:hypothetical protein
MIPPRIGAAERLAGGLVRADDYDEETREARMLLCDAVVLMAGTALENNDAVKLWRKRVALALYGEEC